MDSEVCLSHDVSLKKMCHLPHCRLSIFRQRSWSCRNKEKRLVKSIHIYTPHIFCLTTTVGYHHMCICVGMGTHLKNHWNLRCIPGFCILSTVIMDISGRTTLWHVRNRRFEVCRGYRLTPGWLVPQPTLLPIIHSLAFLVPVPWLKLFFQLFCIQSPDLYY
jgi:hypothetical protein